MGEDEYQRRLTDAALFPILELAYPEPPVETPTPAERTLPRTLAKLRHGERLRDMNSLPRA